MPNVATVDELVTALLNAQTATSPVTITLTNSTLYNLSTSTIPRDSRFGIGTLFVSGLPHIKKDVTINGTGQAGITRTGAKYRHFYVAPGAKLTLNNLALRYGDVDTLDTGGGAVFNEGTLTVNSCEFSYNKSNYGGAILNERGRTDIFRCSIIHNQADWGGGLLNRTVANNCVMNVTDSRVADNQANESYSNGGGIINFGTLTVQHCMITNNSASFAGGIGNWATDAQATIRRSHITLNSAYNGGGGVHNFSGIMQIEDSTLVSNTSPSGSQANRASGTLSITRTALPDNYTAGLVGVTPVTPLPERKVRFIMEKPGNGNNIFTPLYQYLRDEAANRAIQLSRNNFTNFPTNTASSVIGYVDANSSRIRRDYTPALTHVPGKTGSSIFISEMLHYGGMPMTIDAGDNVTTPDCTLTDQTTIGTYDVRGWRYCPPEKSATANWKDHEGIARYFTSLLGKLIGTVIIDEIRNVIWEGPTLNYPSSGKLKGDPNDPQDEGIFSSMRNRFASGGDLSTVQMGDYLYIGNHGFLIVGWGPFLGAIDGITYALNSTLATVRSSSNPIPYIADFCYGTDGNPNGNGTGWLQDPRPRPFYAAAVQVFEGWLRSDQVPYLKKLVVPDLSAQPIAVYDFFTAENDQWKFYKIPSTISLSLLNLPVNRLYFKG